MYARLNQDLHAELFIAAGNDALTDAYEQVLAVPFASPSAFLFMYPRFCLPSTAAGQAEHRLIVEAIRQGDGDTAECLTRQHARASARAFDMAVQLGTDALEGLPGRALITSDGMVER